MISGAAVAIVDEGLGYDDEFLMRSMESSGGGSYLTGGECWA